MLVVKELNYRLPRLLIVDIVAKTRGVNNVEADFESLLFELGLGYADLDGLANRPGMAGRAVCVGLYGGREKSVDEGGFAESGLTGKHDGECGTALCNNLVSAWGGVVSRGRLDLKQGWNVRTFGWGG